MYNIILTVYYSVLSGNWASYKGTTGLLQYIIFNRE
jgi:hypothetical protein